MTVLADVSFEVPAGESVASWARPARARAPGPAPAPAGRPRRPSIRLGGHDLRHLASDELRDAAALVFQESFLFASSVQGEHHPRRRHGRGPDAAGGAGPRRPVRQPAPERAGHRRGRARRHPLRRAAAAVALARALARDPRLLILDDATSAVDPTVEAEILTGLRRELDTTLILIAYRTSTISLADRVLFLDDGRIAATGTHAELLATEPAYAAMVEAYEARRRDEREEQKTTGALTVLRRGLAETPGLKAGFGVDGRAASLAAIGRLLTPVLIQQILDRGVNGPEGFRPGLVFGLCGAAWSSWRPCTWPGGPPTGGWSGPRSGHCTTCG